MEYSSFTDLNNSDKVLYLLIRLFSLKKKLYLFTLFIWLFVYESFHLRSSY